jgi:hypothetical protein
MILLWNDRIEYTVGTAEEHLYNLTENKGLKELVVEHKIINRIVI